MVSARSTSLSMTKPKLECIFAILQKSKQMHPLGCEVCFVCECYADGVNKNLMKFSQLNFATFTNKTNLVTSRMLYIKKILSVPVFLEFYFHDQIYS